MNAASKPLLVLRQGILVLALLAAAGPVRALDRGDPCPGFALPWLDGNGRAASASLLSESPVTVLLFWNRECPHCEALALTVDELAAGAALYDARVVPVAFGPDDPASLRALLARENVQTRQLWDAEGAVAADYGLGLDHLGVFVVHADGRVADVYDSGIADLMADVLPGVIEAVETAPQAMRAAEGAEAIIPTGAWMPRLRTDGRFRVGTTEGARAGDRGLYGEPLESGVLMLMRWDLRLSWDVAPGITFVPWLRVSNEDEVLLTEGPDQFASRHGTASLYLERGRLGAVLGAFPLRISPLLLQRWDEEDAPPLGGVSGCSSCGAGASGLSQRSLEVLGPEYRFEGGLVRWTADAAVLRAWVAVARWERAVPGMSGASRSDSLRARYRRVLSGASLDLGPVGREEPVFGLPSPWGLRIGYESTGDDARSLGEESIRPVDEWDERGVSLLGAAGPWAGVTLDAEHVWWHLTRRTAGLVWSDGWVTDWSEQESDARALRAGLRGHWALGSGQFWARAHRLWSQSGFDPLYAALTYEGNREGWRGAAGYDREEVSPAPVRWSGARVFYRVTEETEPVRPDLGAIRETVASASMRGRVGRWLESQIHLVRTATDRPGSSGDETSLGFSADLRGAAWPSVDPLIRLDALRRDVDYADPHWVWQAYVSVRVLR